MTMQALYSDHYVTAELPWPQHTKESRYDDIMAKLDENVGQWHVFTFPGGINMESARGALITRAKTHGMKVTTSKNGRRLGVKRLL